MPLAPPQHVPVQRALCCPTGRTIEVGKRPLVMGVLNLTPDSFSDGGLWTRPEQAAEHALRLESQGADLLDLGAESTRPGGGTYGDGADPVSPTEEIDRLLPALRRIRQQTDLPISIDTRKGEVAELALDEGADLINDISALEDPHLATVVADRRVPVVLMHSRGQLRTMQREIEFDDVVTEVAADLGSLVDRAVGQGVAPERIIIDPGIGFGKTVEQNVELLANLDHLNSLGFPVLVGASRKSFIGAIDGNRPADRRLAGSLAAVAWAIRSRTSIVRVHDVEETVQFITVCQQLEKAERSQS